METPQSHLRVPDSAISPELIRIFQGIFIKRGKPDETWVKCSISGLEFPSVVKIKFVWDRLVCEKSDDSSIVVTNRVGGATTSQATNLARRSARYLLEGCTINITYRDGTTRPLEIPAEFSAAIPVSNQVPQGLARRVGRRILAGLDGLRG